MYVTSCFSPCFWDSFYFKIKCDENVSWCATLSACTWSSLSSDVSIHVFLQIGKVFSQYFSGILLSLFFSFTARRSVQWYLSWSFRLSLFFSLFCFSGWIIFIVRKILNPSCEFFISVVTFQLQNFSVSYLY